MTCLLGPVLCSFESDCRLLVHHPFLRPPESATLSRAVCNAMRMRSEQKVTHTFHADNCAKYLPGPVPRRKDLHLPHRVHRPSRILRQILCVAHLVLCPLVFLEKDIHEGAYRSARRSRNFRSWCGSGSGKCFIRCASMMMQSRSSGFGLRTNVNEEQELFSVSASLSLQSHSLPSISQ